ncbi:MAG: phosphoribosylformylglycinamidine cyclo-ligase [Armatimonadetes bacterium]|nr:phosphoribosylformylglycinamidine cyclo-ligase [Armatimonadota bacterium]
MADDPLTYRRAGVDTGEAERAVRDFRTAVRSTYTPEVLSDVGAFGGLFAARFEGLREPVLVSSIDSVGTKAKIAVAAGRYRGLGRDIVCHCVNDILAQGARPLFFLDYFAASSLRAETVVEIVDGASEACRENACALIGGETAEMPDVYREGQIDLVGAVVGVVERDKVLPRADVSAGDLIVGIASDGLHTNGYSLARAALFERGRRRPDDLIPDLGRTLAEELLRPHRSYFRALHPILEEGSLAKAVSHITGGGFYENVPRVLPQGVDAVIERRAWTPQPIFSLIQDSGDVETEEMFRTFNMGVGMVVICPSEVAGAVVQRLRDAGETAYLIGEMKKGSGGVQIV